MTNQEIMEIAMRQSAIDCGCEPQDFRMQDNKVVISRENAGARRYLELPFCCNLVSYGNNIVASVSSPFAELAQEYIGRHEVYHCFETPALLELMEKVKAYDCNVCFMAEYFLPDLEALHPLPCKYERHLLEPEDFKEDYLPQWSNALCRERKALDRLAMGAFHDGKMIGMAGCSADCETMWQIGVDVLPGYRRQGIASALTGSLAVECLNRGKVPFYCCAWSNIGSARNAVKSGFRPAWVEVTVKKNSFIDKMLYGETH